jgi:hypothetical protein
MAPLSVFTFGDAGAAKSGAILPQWPAGVPLVDQSVAIIVDAVAFLGDVGTGFGVRVRTT